jgi:hypothetical protein
MSKISTAFRRNNLLRLALLLLFCACKSSRGAQLELRLQEDAAKLLVALNDYYGTYKTYPHDLNQLAPEILAEIPETLEWYLGEGSTYQVAFSSRAGHFKVTCSKAPSSDWSCARY